MDFHQLLCITFTFILVPVHAFFGFEKLFGADVCSFKCSSEKAPVQNPLANPKHNGCGAYGITVSMASYPGFNACCNAHDRCYTSCNSGRSSCDNKFKSCLLQQCGWNAYNGVHDEEMTKTCNHLVKIMTFLVRSFGCTAYQNGQKYSCICS